jgi:hypothetical protein
VPDAKTAAKFKIFGLGLSKTGTSSLAEALQILGFRTAHNPTDDATVQSLLHGQVRCAVTEISDAVCDILFVRHFRELDIEFPNSRFILTVRSREAWLASCRLHWANRYALLSDLANEDLVDFNVYGTTRFSERIFNAAYDAHYYAVQEYFRDRPTDLLTLDVCAGQKWQPLCQFLGKPRPDADFPHIRPPPVVESQRELAAIPCARSTR